MNPKTKDVIVHDGKVTVQGWAYSGNGNWVERVEVSPDGYVRLAVYVSLMTDGICTEDTSGTLVHPRT